MMKESKEQQLLNEPRFREEDGVGEQRFHRAG